MTQFGTIGADADTETLFVEAAEAGELTNLVNAVIAGIDGITRAITAVTLAGAGDGSTFSVLIESTLADDAIGGLAGTNGGVQGTVVRCYLASDPEELARAKEAAGIPPPAGGIAPYAVFDEQLAGASAGQRIMGLTVFSAGSAPLGANSPRLLAVATSTQALGAGETILAFDGLNSGQQFSLPAPQTVLYTGKQAVELTVEASVTVGLTAAGDFTAEIVADPLGTPSVLGSTKGHTAAGEFDNVSILGFAIAEPEDIVSSKLGIRITSDAGSVLSASLRATV